MLVPALYAVTQQTRKIKELPTTHAISEEIKREQRGTVKGKK
jgi:hypothetical protein